MKKCIVSAYFNNNLGDDLFVYSLIKRYPNCTFYVDAEKSAVEFLDGNMNVIIASPIRRLLRRIANKLFKQNKLCYNRKADALVKIGGSIFMEYDGWEENWPVFKKKPFFIISCNFGPYESEKFLSTVADRIKKAKDCCFRDTYSYNIFRNFDNVRTAPDLLFGLDLSDKETRISNRVGISVISLDNRSKLKKYAENYYTTIAKIADDLIEKGYSVCLYGFCKNEGDSDAIKKIEHYAKNTIDSEVYSGQISAFLSSFLSSEFIIASRFHAMILGWVAKRKVYPVIYSDKQRNIIQDMNSDISFLEIEGISPSIVSKVEREMASLPIIDVSREILNAEKQYKELDKFIKDKDND